MIIRPAKAEDIPSICNIYEMIHNEEEKGNMQIGWIRGVYPTKTTAENALLLNELFVAKKDGQIKGSAVINKKQLDCYKKGFWHYQCDDSNIMVMHTLTVSPLCPRQGIGTAFVDFYEKYAKENGCFELRIDTQEKNLYARNMYKKYGFEEIGKIKCEFNGIDNVNLILLEKTLI